MIVEALLNPVFALVDFIIGLFPTVDAMSFLGGPSALGEMLGYALYWFPVDLWILILVNISFWVSVQLGWIVIEWVYKKIPGVD